MNAAKIWQIAKPVLKILAVGALGGAAAKLPEALGASGNHYLTSLAPTIAVILAYVMRPPKELGR